MNKSIKIGLSVVGAFVAIFITAAILLVTLVDPNEYKGEIAQAVKDSTGRTLTFEGDIGFHFFPWLGLDVGPVALSNAPGFAPKEMVRIGKAAANIRILPLLTGEVAIGVIVLDGFHLNLSVNKKGVSNWDNLTAKGEESKATTSSGTGSKSGGQSIKSFDVEGIEITGANVTYVDEQKGTKSSLTNLNFITGTIGSGLDTPFELTFELKMDNPKIDTRPKLVGIASLDMDAGTLKIVDLVLEALNMKMDGTFYAKSKGGKTSYSGELRLNQFSLKETMQQIGMEPPATADDTALTRISANLAFDGTGEAANLEKLTVKLDDTTITTSGGVKNFNAPAITVNTNIDHIDVDRYLPPKQEGGTTEKKETEAKSDAPAEEPDLTGLKDLDLTTRLTIGKAKAMNLTVTEILCETRAKNGIITVKPFSAKLYDGSLSGHSTLNLNNRVAAWDEGADLKGVQAGPLLKDLTGKDHIHGTTVAKYSMTGRGLTADNIKKSVTGTASFAFTDGAINGVNVAKMLRDAWAKIKGKPVSPDEPAKTDFAELLGSAVLKNGYITNDDLLMKSPLLRVTGKGWADLPKNAVDYLATVTVVGTLKGQDGESMEDLKGLPLPIYAKGDLDKPKIGLDAKAMAEALVKGTFKNGTKGLEEKLKKSILGGEKKPADGQKRPGIKGLF